MTAVVTAENLLQLPAGKANGFYRESCAGGTRLSDGNGWTFTVVAARDDVRRGNELTGVVLTVIAEKPPADWDAMPGWLWRDRPGSAVPAAGGGIQVTFAVKPDTEFNHINP